MPKNYTNSKVKLPKNYTNSKVECFQKGTTQKKMRYNLIYCFK